MLARKGHGTVKEWIDEGEEEKSQGMRVARAEKGGGEKEKKE